jgi:cellulose synthase/poly-beta-1,6-N-acetylglucosamine synthase-like glycosyltransferase
MPEFFALVFWICAAALAYAYLGYPLLIWCLGRWLGRSTSPPALADAELPTVSLLIAAYNEEPVIEERIRNALALDYPADKLEIVIASDGSTDATADIARRFAQSVGQAGVSLPSVRLLDYPIRRGKASVLNSSVPELRGDVILLSDANTEFDRMAARNIVRWFEDPEIGVVCGRLVLVDPETGQNADSLYWRYETFLKKCEGQLRALLGANGGIYAIRRPLFQPIPRETIVDDLVIPLQAKLRTGCAIVYDSQAVAREETPATVESEFHRRSRIGAGGFQSIGLLWRLLDPRQGWIAFTFVSHKVLRWLCPFFMLGLLLVNPLLWQEPFYRLAFVTQAAFYLTSVLVGLVPGRFKTVKPLRITTMFAGMNAALLVGFWRWLRGSQGGAWKRTARLAEADGSLA